MIAGIVVALAAHAADVAPVEGAAPVDAGGEPSTDRRSILVLPGAFYSQETSVGLALFGSATFPLEHTGDATWPSTVVVVLDVTAYRQVSLTAWTSFYLGASNDWVIETESFVEHFPANYYGIGPDSGPAWQVFTRRQLRSDVAVRRQVLEHLFLGLAHHLALVEVVDVQDPRSPGRGPAVWTADDLLGGGNVPGESGGRVHGLGALARWDSRDNSQSTRRGGLVDLELSGYAPAIGSTTAFSIARLDVRGFLPVGDGGALAGQWLTEIGVGAVPFTSMPELGGDDLMRGLYQGRLRDLGASSAQVELRSPFVWRFRAVAFAGAGQVFPSLGTSFANPPTWTAGGGGRFELDRASHATVRADVGAGPGGAGFIFTFGEAF